MVDMSATSTDGGAFELEFLELEYESNRCSMLSLVVLEMDQDEEDEAAGDAEEQQDEAEEEDENLDTDGVTIISAGAKASACWFKKQSNAAIARDGIKRERFFDILCLDAPAGSSSAAGCNYSSSNAVTVVTITEL